MRNQTTQGCVFITAVTVSECRSKLQIQQEGISLVNLAHQDPEHSTAPPPWHQGRAEEEMLEWPRQVTMGLLQGGACVLTGQVLWVGIGVCQSLCLQESGSRCLQVVAACFLFSFRSALVSIILVCMYVCINVEGHVCVCRCACTRMCMCRQGVGARMLESIFILHYFP